MHSPSYALDRLLEIEARARSLQIEVYRRRSALWNGCQSLGSDFSDQIDVRFDSTYAAQSLRAIRSTEIPRPVVTDSRVHDVRFKVDVTSVVERSSMTLENVCAAIIRSS
jgi:hypothetical protein